MEVRIVDFPETRVAVLRHRGTKAELDASTARFIAWRKATGLSPVKTSRTYGVVRYDPRTSPPGDFPFDICGTVDGEIPPNPQGVENGVIPGGRCAVLRHIGSHECLGESVRRLVTDWLPDSGETRRDAPVFFHYLNVGVEVAEGALETDVYLPVE
jgi:AraC family transcriptional regulator